MYTDVYSSATTQSGVWCGKNDYDDSVVKEMASIMWNNNQYEFRKIIYNYPACGTLTITSGAAITPTNITTDGKKSLKALLEDLNKHRNINTIYQELISLT